MCGIWCCVGIVDPEKVKTSLESLEARGPEGSRTLRVWDNVHLGFTRLALNGLNNAGMQPMEYGKTTWVCNGEIYNWKELAKQYGLTNNSGSDCEILGELYERFRELEIPIAEFFRALDGVFAIVIVDTLRKQIVVGRDPYGVRPLYTATSGANTCFASEMKAIQGFGTIKQFPPGSYQVMRFQFDMGAPTNSFIERYHEVPWMKNPTIDSVNVACTVVRESFIKAVKKRLMTDHSEIAVTLSGGLDSSLVAAIAAAEWREAGKGAIRTFSIGMAGSTDLFYARLVADRIGSIHTEIVKTPEEFFAAIPHVIRDIESFDTTTVRASVGNWLVAKHIREHSPCKIVLNGDGSDEVWGSYLYFKNAPNDHAFEAEVTRLLQDIHYFDVLRSDRCISSHGLEPRTPFLDKEFVAIARSIPTLYRRPVDVQEKWLLRTAFETCELLPYDVLWRQKEAFSDGVSGTEKSWYQIAQEMARETVGAEWVGKAPTPEKYYYNKLYRSCYGKDADKINVPYFWMPRWSNTTDPSARTLAVYSS